jgi:rfaE bifunctional protein kinase chain/domain
VILFSEERLREISKEANHKKVIVFGDLMVDEYLWGKVSRISPEAPVPIINIDAEQLRFGGAANVANNLIGLQGTPLLLGVVGDDRMGHIFTDMLQEKQLISEGIIMTNQRPTTVKTRIIGNNQHVARVDKESVKPLSVDLQNKLFETARQHIDEISAIIIQDYNKGVVSPELVRRLIDLAVRKNKYVTVDPKFENFLSFENVTVFKPNVKETEEALAMRLRDEAEVIEAGNILLSKLNSKAVLITRGAQGMALFEKNETPIFVGTRARKVADVSGAGDTVIATLTYALCGGASIKEAVTLSTYAAGQVCEEVGVVPVDGEKLVPSILRNQRYFE